jgi:hypothetical protein
VRQEWETTDGWTAELADCLDALILKAKQDEPAEEIVAA